MIRDRVRRAYERHLERTITDPPQHIAVIQDGNRRYARKKGAERETKGHHKGAKTTEQLLDWCQDFTIQELTLYAFSTENFNRPQEEREELFDLIEEKLYEFAESTMVHEEQVKIVALGERSELPQRVRAAIRYAETQTQGYDQFRLNVALAYGGRSTLLGATKQIARDAIEGNVDPEEIDVETIKDHLYEEPIRDVDLIIRTGGEKRTSNFLPWHSNGNEAAVYFCTPYWPSFSRSDFLRGLRTYEHRQESFQQSRVQRALALLRELGSAELEEAREILSRTNTDDPELQSAIENNSGAKGR
nr:polyprenyl diphosphate synthase [Salinarchaeum sp. IM2453]